jgi:DNA-binding CsgD family transcriptional regulator
VIWTGGKLPAGYGRLSFNGLFVYAHRLAYETFVEPIPPGLYVLHKCDRPSCIRPEHLFVGTATDNAADMDSKGRRGSGRNRHIRRGTEHHSARLTENDVLQIRASALTAKELSARFGVTPRTIRKIRRGTRWAHI